MATRRPSLVLAISPIDSFQSSNAKAVSLPAAAAPVSGRLMDKASDFSRSGCAVQRNSPSDPPFAAQEHQLCNADFDLFRALSKGDIHAVNAALSAGANIDLVRPDKRGETPLHYAAAYQNSKRQQNQNDSTTLVSELLAHDPKPLLQTNEDGESPLHYAARYSQKVMTLPLLFLSYHNQDDQALVTYDHHLLLQQDNFGNNVLHHLFLNSCISASDKVFVLEWVFRQIKSSMPHNEAAAIEALLNTQNRRGKTVLDVCIGRSAVPPQNEMNAKDIAYVQRTLLSRGALRGSEVTRKKQKAVVHEEAKYRNIIAMREIADFSHFFLPETLMLQRQKNETDLLQQKQRELDAVRKIVECTRREEESRFDLEERESDELKILNTAFVRHSKFFHRKFAMLRAEVAVRVIQQHWRAFQQYHRFTNMRLAARRIQCCYRSQKSKRRLMLYTRRMVTAARCISRQGMNLIKAQRIRDALTQQRMVEEQQEEAALIIQTKLYRSYKMRHRIQKRLEKSFERSKEWVEDVEKELTFFACRLQHIRRHHREQKRDTCARKIQYHWRMRQTSIATRRRTLDEMAITIIKDLLIKVRCKVIRRKLLDNKLEGHCLSRITNGNLPVR